MLARSRTFLFAALATVLAPGALAQSEAPPGMHGGMGPGMGSGPMMGMMEMMQGCRQMMQARGAHPALPRLPAGNEKLELQMHADMMRAMADVLTKYAGRLPDKK